MLDARCFDAWKLAITTSCLQCQEQNKDATIRYSTTMTFRSCQSLYCLLGLSRRGIKLGNNKRCSSSLMDILRSVQEQKLTIEQAAERISSSMNRKESHDTDILLESFANLDHGRSKRTGFPEAVFGEGKTATQVAAILDDMARHANESSSSNNQEAPNAILATRITPGMYSELEKIPLKHGAVEYHPTAKIVSMTPSHLSKTSQSSSSSSVSLGRVVVATAGTTDVPVAEEGAVTLEAASIQVDRVYDAGVAGLHRIIKALPRLRHPQVGCIIVCAGMDGALPSVVGGLVSVPVIAVPTSVGYGASLSGISALLTMVNSCSPGVGVVNIDNGFGAAALAFKCMRNSK